MTFNARSLIQLQVKLEYQMDLYARLVPIPDSEEQARYIIYRHTHGYERFYRHDLPESLLRKLSRSSPSQAFEAPASIATLLETEIPGNGFPVFLSGYLPQIPNPRHGAQAVWKNSCWVIEVEGKAIAWAWSVRSNHLCAELAVEVDPAFRQQGHAYQVVAAWARQVLEDGRFAFYSHRVDNFPSQALARSLGVEVFAQCIAFD